MTARGQLAGADAPANAGTAGGTIVNAMTIDVEDYFQVSAFDAVVRREAWADFPSRVVANTEKILSIFSEHRVKATFFVLGWVAERFPSIVASIAAAGHELASHVQPSVAGRRGCREDVRRAKALIEDQGPGRAGYRALGYHHAQVALGAGCSSRRATRMTPASSRFDTTGTAFPTRRVIRILKRARGLTEAPPSTVRMGSMNCVAGGGFPAASADGRAGHPGSMAEKNAGDFLSPSLGDRSAPD
jgi:hypothetical protein